MNENSFSVPASRVPASKLFHPGRRGWKLRLDALSRAEWNYLCGLFLTDGYSDRSKKQGRYRVRFLLQGNEGGLASRVAELLRRVGLNPRVYRDKMKDMLTVEVKSMRLFDLLPNKEGLNNSRKMREWFFKKNGLFTIEGGVPFLAGLLDGDGYCGVRLGEKYFFPSVIVSTWCFAQDNELYLVDYAKRFIESLAPRSVRVKRRRGRKTRTACIRRHGIMALLDARIAHHSWKVFRWLEQIAEARSKRAGFLSVRQVAGLLHVPYGAVSRLVSSGSVPYMRAGRRRYIRAIETERLKRELGESRDC